MIPTIKFTKKCFERSQLPWVIMVYSVSIYTSTTTACCGLVKFCAVKKGIFLHEKGEKKRQNYISVHLSAFSVYENDWMAFYHMHRINLEEFG